MSDRGKGRSNLPFLYSQPSVNDDDLFGSGEDELEEKDKQKTEDDVFQSTSASDQVVPASTGADDVFTRQSLHSEQVVPESYDSTSSSSVEVRRSHGSTSSSSAELKRESFRNSRESGNVEEAAIRRTLSLPDIVPKDNGNETESFKQRRQNLSDNSPDVVSSSENKSSSSNEPLQSLTSTSDNISDLKQPSLGNLGYKSKKLSRSVSFKEKNISHEYEDDSDDKSQEANSRRENFRSSGYFTGESSKASSVQSQTSSVFSGSEDQGTNIGEDVLDGNFQTTDCKNQWSPSSNESEKITVKSFQGNKGEPVCNLIPLLSAIHPSSISADSPSSGVKDSQSGSNSSVQIHSSQDSNSSITIPNFDILLTEKGSNSSTGTSTSETYDSLKHVQKKYCKDRDESDSKSPPSFATYLPSSPYYPSADTGLPSSISSRAMESDLPDDQFDYKGYKENMTREMLQQQNIDESQKLDLLESPVTPSPRDYSNVLPQKITSETIEKSSRCRDVLCAVKFCSKVREGFIGLDRTLEGQWPYGSSPDVSDLCCGLGRHSTTPCDELKCAVRWCYYLSAEFSEHPRGEFVYRALKRYYDMPVLSSTAFPPTLKPSKFFKLNEQYRRDKPVYGETLSTFGDYGNVYYMEDATTVIKKVKFQNSDYDIDNTVYRKLCNRSHKCIVDHIWAAVYSDIEEIHVCTVFVRGGTLENLLQSKLLLNPVIVQDYMLQILDAVTFLHRRCGVIYLYWTTSNMLFLNPKRHHILISNLSLSVPANKEFDVGYIKQSLPPCLTPPELIVGDEDLKLTGIADSWGIGCMMVEMLSGRQMWYNERHENKNSLTQKIKNREISLKTYIPKKPDAFHRILTKCFEFDCEKRMSCEEIQIELRNWKYD